MPATRRHLLKTAAASFCVPAILTSKTRAANAPKTILFFTKSSGFEHSVVHREGSSLAHAERVLTDIATPKDYKIVCSKDGSLFNPDKIGDFDAFVFYTTGDLTKSGTDKQPPMTEDGLNAMLEAIRAGKGFMGMHCATDTFGTHRGRDASDPYTKLVGGNFNGHGAQQIADITVSDPKFPGAAAFGPSFKLNDEWYSQKFQPDDLHVIMYHNTKDMQGADYKRPNYPQTWARAEGKGRSFYTSMGHREDVWTNPKYQGLLLGALDWITGRAEADVTPNVKSVTPEYQTIDV
jgi:type 1 glutamine amidotransferase